jgi:hypothetical protein
MHSALVRAQNVFGFFTTVAFAVAALIAASDMIAARTPSATVSVDKVQVYVWFFYLEPCCTSALFPHLRFMFHSIIPFMIRADAFELTVYEVVHIITARKKNNTPISASHLTPTCLRSSLGTQSKCLYMLQLSGLQIPYPRTQEIWKRA